LPAKCWGMNIEMGDLRQRQESTTVQQPARTNDPHPGRKAVQKGWAIERNQALEQTVEEAENRIRGEMGMDVAIEELETSSFQAFLDASGPLPDEDDYDFSEYEEDSPLADPDGVTDNDAFIGATEFDILSGGSDPEPSPDIIIDEFGHITIPLEDMIFANYCRTHNGKALGRKFQIDLKNAKDLRRVAEALLEKERDRILGDKTDLSGTYFPYTQKNFLGALGITGKEVCSKFTNRYVKTPCWGIIHLSVFFGGKEDEWRSIMDAVKNVLKGENVEYPYDNNQVWEEVRQDFSLGLKDNQMFRKKLRESGIPLKKARKDIYDVTRKWKQHGSVVKINRSDIPGIRLTLHKKFNLFDSKQTKQCKEEQFIPFVEERIEAVLKKLGVEIPGK
jgi:hypothetical protein